MHDEADPVDGELIIPIKRGRVFARSGYSLGVLAICVGGVVVLLTPRFSHLHVAWLIFGIAFNMLFVIGAGMMAYNDLRSLRSRRLRLDSTGFELGADRWAWKDLSAIDRLERWDGEDRIVRISLRFRPGCSEGATSSVTPINPPDFDTGGRPLEDIMRDWLQRYGTHQQEPLEEEPG